MRTLPTDGGVTSIATPTIPIQNPGAGDPKVFATVPIVELRHSNVYPTLKLCLRGSLRTGNLIR